MSKGRRSGLSRTLFTTGFLVSLAFFAGANICSYRWAIPPCCDLSIGFGVPFRLGTYGGYVGGTSLLLTGLITDTLVSIGASLVFGWVFANLFPTILRSVQQAVEWHVGSRS